jgi:capsular exopolysaccharide synthesis family protein
VDRELRDYLRVLRKRKWYLVLTVAAAVGCAALFTAQAPRLYEAGGTLFVGQRQIPREDVEQDPRLAVAVSDLSFRLLSSYTEVLASRSISEKAISEFQLEISPRALRESVRARPIPNTQIIELVVSNSDPTFAQRVTNGIADVFVREVSRLDPTAGGGDPVVNVSVLDRATVPTDPVSPQPVRNILIALALGLAAGIGLILLVERLDVTVKQATEVEKLGLPSLGSVPTLDIPRDVLYLEQDPQGLGGEAFRKLRTSLGFLGVELPLRTVLVTSPGPTEGKTTIALNLASAFAFGGLRTLLIEGDLRRPSLHLMFGMRGTKGLTTAIVGQVTPAEAVTSTDVPNLSVMLAGAIPPNPVELLGSEQMSDLLDHLKKQYDVLIIDSPPLIPVADPAVLASRCDGVVLVARSGKTDRRRLADSAQIIERVGGRLLGIVLNFVRRGDDDADYGYSYQYAPATSEDAPAPERAARG